MKSMVTATLVLAAIFAQATPVLAADHKLWIGRDVDNNSKFWTLSKIAGDSWVLKENGKKFADCDAI